MRERGREGGGGNGGGARLAGMELFSCPADTHTHTARASVTVTVDLLSATPPLQLHKRQSFSPFLSQYSRTRILKHFCASLLLQKGFTQIYMIFYLFILFIYLLRFAVLKAELTRF